MTNLEFKARLRNPATIYHVLAEHNIPRAATLRQTDTYFQAVKGRLKLREIEGEKSQLIFYMRPDAAEVKRSDYLITPIESASTLREVLGAAYGVRAVVKKIRELYLLPRQSSRLTSVQTDARSRLHLDTVDGLGKFLEIEVILQEGESPAQAEQEARTWLLDFGITPEDLMKGSYADLLESQRA